MVAFLCLATPQVILFGGLQAGIDMPSNKLCRLDAVAGEFVPMHADGTAPCPRWCHSAVMLSNGGVQTNGTTGDSLMIFGGWRYPRSIFLNDVHLLNIGDMLGFSFLFYRKVPSSVQ